MTERSRTGSIDVDGGRLAFEEAGAGDPVVLLHAGIADRRMWRFEMESWSSRHRVVAYDARGHGDSQADSTPFFPHLDLTAVLDHLAIERASFVGASMGGSTAIDFALASPERVERLLLLGPALGGYEFQDPDWLRRWAEVEKAYEDGERELAAARECEIWLAGPARKLEAVPRPVVELVTSALLRHYDIGEHVGEEESLSPAAVGRLAEVPHPTLLMVGRWDVPDILAVADLLASGLPRVTRVDVDAAHLPSLECPELIERAMSRFLAGRTP